MAINIIITVRAIRVYIVYHHLGKQFKECEQASSDDRPWPAFKSLEDQKAKKRERERETQNDWIDDADDAGHK